MNKMKNNKMDSEKKNHENPKILKILIQTKSAEILATLKTLVG